MEDLLQLQLLARQQRTPYAVATIVEATGSTPRTEGKMLVYADGRSAGTIGGGLAELRAKKDAADAIRCGKNRLVRYEVVPQAAASGMACGGALQVFIEVYGTRPLLVVCGGGHVGTCVLRAAKLTGFELWLFDDRPQEAVAEAAALADHQKQTATGMVILLVHLQMVVQVVDAAGEQRDLNLGRAGVAFLAAVLCNNFLLGHFGSVDNQHGCFLLFLFTASQVSRRSHRQTERAERQCYATTVILPYSARVVNA